MVNNVILGSSIRNNLLSIVNTQRLVDRTTLRLATGLEVNSAIESPQKFFAARSLNNRANDLRRLLDNINQDINTIKEADNGVQALSANVQQGQAIAQQALDLLAQAETSPVVRGNKDISQVADLTTLAGINVGDRIRISSRGNDTITYTPPFADFTITAGLSATELATQINVADATLAFSVIQTEITDEGFLQFTAVDELALYFEFDAVGPPDDAANLALAAAFGYSEIATLSAAGNGTNEVQFTLNPTRTLTSFNLFNAATNGLAVGTDLISALEGANNTALFGRLDSPADQFEIGFNGGARQSILLDNTQTVDGFVSAINGNPELQGFLEAEFIEESGKITITAVDSSVSSIETAATSDDVFGVFFGFNNAISLLFGAGTAENTIQLGSISGPDLDELRSLEEDYNQVLQSISDIAEDASFNGINLLAGENLTSFFNEDLSNSLFVTGVNFTANGLALKAADFQSVAGAQSAIDDSISALNEIRSFGGSLANSLSIIQSRKDFTEVTINTLEAGAGDLIDADLNEEGAAILALQTRQNLASVALSLGSQSQSGILRIFA